VALSAVTVVASLVAWLRRISGVPSHGQRISLGWRAVTLLLIAGAFTVAAIFVSRAGASQQFDAGFTQLWMVQSQKNGNVIRVGMESRELTGKTYRLELTTAGEALYEWPPISLQPGQSWSTQVVLGGQVAATTPVDALLYQADTPGQVYRRARVWVGQP
jgi:hypothetical protein